MENSRPFIRAQVAIDSMRDNGFLSAAHALAELIDNSIQNNATRVEIIAFEERSAKAGGARETKKVERIGVFDNGWGMDKDTLHLALEFGASKHRDDKDGMGKFGMGLPNASISQCKRVDVWSWTKDSPIHHTYLDVDDIKGGQLEAIPSPLQGEIPSEILKCLGEKLPVSGTFVLWSKIDRCQWKTANSIQRHTEDIVGRMYRYFINEGRVNISFISAERNESVFAISSEHKFKANDPLYLMKNTSLPDLPGHHKGEAMFELVEEDNEFVLWDGNDGDEQFKVKIIGTILKQSACAAIAKTTTGKIGSTPWGVHAQKNIGLSVIRAGRELTLAKGYFSKSVEPYEARWCGIEIQFPPALDKVFGVTNNKQHAVNLKPLDITKDWADEGFNSQKEYEADLEANKDPKLQIYRLIGKVNKMIATLENRLKDLDFDGKKIDESKPKPSSDSTIPSSTIKINELEGQREERHPTTDKAPSLSDVQELLKNRGGETEEDAYETAKQILEHKLKVWVKSRPMATDAFFDVASENGFTLLQINENHVFTKKILNKVTAEQKESLEICLAGWARLENESQSVKYREFLERARKDWGIMLDQYLGDDIDE